MSHRQQAMRIANNIEEFSPWSVCVRLRSQTGIPYQCFEEPLDRRPARHRRHLAGNLRALDLGGIDLANGPVAGVD